jgi:CRP/FNR family transcriptional regulator, cyclic AMP receptor protein
VESKRPNLRLAPDMRAALIRYGARAVWPAGFSIYQRQQPAEGLFVVLSGRVVLRSRVKAGRGFVPVVAAEGETFGAEGLIPGGRYGTDARAEEASETLHLSGAQVRTCMREQPLVGAALMAQLMVERSALLEKLRELATLSVEERLIAALLRMADQSAIADGEPLVLGPAQYRLLCELVGATRESVSLVFNRLVSAGLVERDGTTFAIPDVPALAKRLSAAWVEEDATMPATRDDDGGTTVVRGG